MQSKRQADKQTESNAKRKTNRHIYTKDEMQIERIS